MFKLTNRLAISNLVKNRSLYYPFALATIVATAILYSFVSLAHSPNLEATYGGTAARMTLQFGISVIQIAVLILITYANSFVMKNRSKELGLYSILGMEKRHLLLMTFFEMFYFSLVTIGLCVDSIFKFAASASVQLASFDERKEGWREERTISWLADTFRTWTSCCGLLYCAHS